MASARIFQLGEPEFDPSDGFIWAGVRKRMQAKRRFAVVSAHLCGYDRLIASGKETLRIPVDMILRRLSHRRIEYKIKKMVKVPKQNNSEGASQLIPVLFSG